MFLTKLNEVLSSEKSFISDRLNFASLGVALLINIIHWVSLYIKIKPSNQNILIHYNIIYGPDFVEKASYVYFIPGLALVIFLANSFISAVFYKKEKLPAYFLNFATIAVQVIFLAATITIILINE